MLKWTVGNRKGGGGKRSPSGRGSNGAGGGGGSGPCYSIRRAAARLQQAARRSGAGSGSRGDKENCENDDVMSPRTRDSVYMRLDSIPAALRDLSNQLAPAPAASTPTHRPRSSINKTPVSAGRRARSAGKQRRVRTPRSPVHPESDDAVTAAVSGVAGIAPLPVLPPVAAPQTARSPSPAPTLPPRQPLATATATTTTTTTAAASLRDAFPATTTTKRGAASPLRIEYSPCPLRATRSLLTLRRRLVDAFAPPPQQTQQPPLPPRGHPPPQHHSVGTLHPPASVADAPPSAQRAYLQTSHDNPLYFTLHNRSRVDSVLDSSLSPDELPRKVRRRLVLGPDGGEQPACAAASVSAPALFPGSAAPSVSPLTRYLQSLCLDSQSASGSYANQCDTFYDIAAKTNYGSDGQVNSLSNGFNNNSLVPNGSGMGVSAMGHAKNVSGGIDSLRVAEQTFVQHAASECVAMQVSTAHDTTAATVRIGHDATDPRFLSAFEAPVASEESSMALPAGPRCRPSPPAELARQTDDFKIWRQTSLRRTRTLTQNSEDGPPPPKMQSHAPAEAQGEADDSRRPSLQERRRPRRSARRRSRSAGGLPSGGTLRGLGDGVFAVDCTDADPPTAGECVFSSGGEGGRRSGGRRGSIPRRASTSGEELDDDTFTLRRRGGFRRRGRAGLERRFANATAQQPRGTATVLLAGGPAAAPRDTATSPVARPREDVEVNAAAAVATAAPSDHPVAPAMPSFSTIRYGLATFAPEHFPLAGSFTPSLGVHAHEEEHPGAGSLNGSVVEMETSSIKNTPSPTQFRTEQAPLAVLPVKPMCGLTLPEGIPSPPSPEPVPARSSSSPPFRIPTAPAAPPPLLDPPAPPLNPAQGLPPTQPPPPPLPIQAEPHPPPPAPASADDPESSSSEGTWNSHRMHFMKTPRLSKGHILSQEPPTPQSRDLSPADSALGEQGSVCSEAPTVADFGECGVDSPLALVDQTSRSRRCLTFSSPGSSTRHRRAAARRFAPWRRPRDSAQVADPGTPQRSTQGELDLAIYGNSGLLTIHVLCGRNLRKAGGTTCNAYVKVALVPASEERTFHRTAVHRESSAPWFDQKFSCEVLPEDLEKRVLVSVWHRDKEKRRSEFLGCMSFAVKNAVKKEISGSFRLLSQSAGRSQHAPAAPAACPAAVAPPAVAAPGAVRSRASVSSSVEEVISLCESNAASTPVHAMERRKSCAKKKVAKSDPTPSSSSSAAPTTTTVAAGSDDSSFLRHLELEPGDAPLGRGGGPAYSNKGGRTPFTTTRKLTRHGGSGFGFSVAWTQPPRVERVEAGQSADRAGLRPGDYIIFVEKYNVVTMPEDEVLQLIRSCGNALTLEVYRRGPPNGLVNSGGGGNGDPSDGVSGVGGGGGGGGGVGIGVGVGVGACGAGAAAAMAGIGAPSPSPAPPPRSSTTCSATTTSLDLSKRRLHLPQVTFSSEADPLNREDARRRAVYQLLHKEQHFAQAMQFGVGRFLLPLADRKDLLSANDHQTLFQNVEELLRLSEDVVEQSVGEEGDQMGQNLGRTYYKKIAVLTNAYRRYFLGLKKADCLLVAKTKNTEFMRQLLEPPVPRKRPDLTTFLHKPLEHYRDILKLLQTILHYSKVADEDHTVLSKVVQELQVTYRDVMAGAGLMEPEAEGRPLLTMQDLESRLVFTRCKPFVLNTPGRQWIFGGDLSRVEGRAVRPFWALLFTDLLLFAKVSRDRVLFITEEPLSLLAVTQAFFNIRKRANEFRLLIDGGAEGNDSPAAGCGPELPLSRNPRKGVRRRTVSLRAPTAELKAVWQNLIQRQIIYLNTARGGTPASSPLDSPDQPTTLSVATLDSLSLRRQVRPHMEPPQPTQPCDSPLPSTTTPQMQDVKSLKSLNNSQRHLDELIDHKCRQLGKSGGNKGSALHLAQWMRGQLGGSSGPLTPDDEPEPEVWSPETLRRRSEQFQALNASNVMGNRNESRCEELELSDTERSNSRSTERSRSHSTSDSQVTVRSGGPEQHIAVCRKCHKTCLANNTLSSPSIILPDSDINALEEDDNDIDDKWGPLMLMGLSALTTTVGLGRHLSSDPFSPTEVPMISVLPPTPDTMPRNTNYQWDEADGPPKVATGISKLEDFPFQASPEPITQREDDEESCDNEDQEPPYKSLTSATGLKRFGTLASLEMLEGDEEQDAEDSSNSDDGDEWDSDVDEKEKSSPESQNVQPQLEVVTQSLRGWTARAGSFVAEKMALFERLGEDSRAAAFLDRYLRPAAEPQLTHTLASSLPDPATSSDDYETSAATSDDVWGTPTSGGDMDDISFPSPESAVASQQESPAISPTSISAGDEETELMMDELLATPPLSSTTRGFPPRCRLEPLLEEDDTDISPTSTPGDQEETPSPEQDSGAGGVADICIALPTVPGKHQSLGFFNRLRRSKRYNDTQKVKGNKLLGFLSNKKSEDDGGGVIGSKALFRIFGRNHVDDIPTSLPPQLAPRQTNEKQLDKRFWRQLRRRRRGEGTISSPAQISA